MPVIQGGGVVYDQGAAMRESADSLTKALQNLQLIRQNQRKLDQEGLEAAYRAFQMVQASSGLPMQMFMGTEMAKPLLDNIFEMTSRVTGRAMDGNTAKQVSNMLYEYSTNPNNYTKGTWAEFLLTRMGGSSTAEKTEPPRSEEKVDPSNLGKKSDSNLFLTRNDDKGEGGGGIGNNTATALSGGVGGDKSGDGGTENVMGGDTVVSGTSDVIETGGGVVGTGGDNTGVVEGSGTAVGNSVINDSAQISPGTVPVLQSPGNIVLNPNIRSSDLWNMLAGRGQYPPSPPSANRGNSDHSLSIVPNLTPDQLLAALQVASQQPAVSQGTGSGAGLSQTSTEESPGNGESVGQRGTAPGGLNISTDLRGTDPILQEITQTFDSVAQQRTLDLLKTLTGNPDLSSEEAYSHIKHSVLGNGIPIKDVVQYLKNPTIAKEMLRYAQEDPKKFQTYSILLLANDPKMKGKTYQITMQAWTRLPGSNTPHIFMISQPWTVGDPLPKGFRLMTDSSLEYNEDNFIPYEEANKLYGPLLINKNTVPTPEEIMARGSPPLASAGMPDIGMGSLFRTPSQTEKSNVTLVSDTKPSESPKYTEKEIVDLYNRAYPYMHFKTFSEINDWLMANPDKQLITESRTEKGAKSPQAFSQAQVELTPSPTITKENPPPSTNKTPSKEIKKDPAVEAAAQTPVTDIMKILKLSGNMNLKYTGPNANANADTIRTLGDGIFRFFGLETPTFKDKSIAHRSAVALRTTATDLWNSLSKEDRDAAYKWAKEYVDKTTPAESFIVFGKDFAAQKLSEMEYKARINEAASQIAATQASVQVAGLRELFGAIGTIYGSYSNMMTNLLGQLKQTGAKTLTEAFNKDPLLESLYNQLVDIGSSIFYLSDVNSPLTNISVTAKPSGLFGLGRSYEIQKGANQPTGSSTQEELSGAAKNVYEKYKQK